MTIKKVKTKKKICWEVTTRLPADKAKRVRRRFNKKIEAQEFLDSLRFRKKSLGSKGHAVKGDVEGTSVNQEIDYWLEKKGPYFTPGYRRVVNPALTRIRKALGTEKISSMTPERLTDFRLSLKDEGLSPATQNRYTDIITRVLNFSFTQRRIDYNPCLGYQKVKESTDTISFWDKSEAQNFLAFANEKYPTGSSKRWVYVVYLMALETGMRAREIWGVKVCDLPREDLKLRVVRQAIRKGFSHTKGKDFRFVPFTSSLKEESRLLCEGSNQFDRCLFTSLRGGPIDHDSFSKRVFKRDLVESRLRAIRFHDLRHTAITLMVLRNIPLPIIQKIAGHKDVKTTMRYVHLVGASIDSVGSASSFA